jgi:hypothetical protein
MTPSLSGVTDSPGGRAPFAGWRGVLGPRITGPPIRGCDHVSDLAVQMPVGSLRVEPFGEEDRIGEPERVRRRVLRESALVSRRQAEAEPDTEIAEELVSFVLRQHSTNLVCLARRLKSGRR